jgi:hypothetical protein
MECMEDEAAVRKRHVAPIDRRGHPLPILESGSVTQATESRELKRFPGCGSEHRTRAENACGLGLRTGLSVANGLRKIRCPCRTIEWTGAHQTPLSHCVHVDMNFHNANARLATHLGKLPLCLREPLIVTRI